MNMKIVDQKKLEELFHGSELPLDSWEHMSGVERKIITEDDIAFGYIVYDNNGKIWSLEVKPEYKGQGYGKMMLKHYLNTTYHDVYTLTPITEELIDFYKRFGFEETDEYEDHLAEFPIMELVL